MLILDGKQHTSPEQISDFQNISNRIQKLLKIYSSGYKTAF